MLYKYPQAEFPYNDLVATNRARGKLDLAGRHADQMPVIRRAVPADPNGGNAKLASSVRNIP